MLEVPPILHRRGLLVPLAACALVTCDRDPAHTTVPESLAHCTIAPHGATWGQSSHAGSRLPAPRGVPHVPCRGGAHSRGGASSARADEISLERVPSVLFMRRLLCRHCHV